MKSMKIKFTPLSIVFLVIWLACIGYSIWYFSTGWNEQNAIMRYCATFNDTNLGWGKYVFGYAVLNIVAGYAAIYFALSPIIFIISFFINSCRANAAFAALFTTLISSAIMVAFTVTIIYSGLFLISERPLISGLIILCGILAGLASCCTLVRVVHVYD